MKAVHPGMDGDSEPATVFGGQQAPRNRERVDERRERGRHVPIV